MLRLFVNNTPRSLMTVDGLTHSALPLVKETEDVLLKNTPFTNLQTR